MKIRLFAAALAAVMSLALFVGCDNKGDAGTTTTTEATTTTTEETTTTVDTTTATDDTTAASKQSTTKKVTTTKATTTKATYRTLGTVTTEATDPINVTESTTTTSRTVPSRTKTTQPDLSHIFPIRVTGNAEERAQMINNNLNGKKKIKIASDRATVQAHDHTGYAFNHHPDIAVMNGTIYVTYTQSKRDEDAPGQQVVVASSKDFFTWTDPIVCGPCTENTLYPSSVTANVPYGLVAWDGVLYQYYAARMYGAHKFDSQGRFQANNDLEGVDTVIMSKSTDGGKTWEQMKSGGYSGMPRKSLTGRWYTQQGYGMKWLNYGEEPNGLYWRHSGSMEAADQNDANNRVKKLNGVLTESSMYESPDYGFHIMVRSEAGYLWHTESLDNGETWSGLYPTKFTSASSMWQFGNLPDGRVFGVGSSDISQGRYPLELWVSDDGINFDTCYILRDEYDLAHSPGEIFVPKGQNSHCHGWAKGGQYGYPHWAIDGEYMYVTYSRHKEMMEITRVKLSDIL